MSLTGLVCPRCGKNSNEIEFIDAFCIDCYQVDIKLPAELAFDVCKRCEKMKFIGEWQRVSEDKLGSYIIGKCRGDFSNATYDRGKNTVTFFIKKGSKTVSIDKTLHLKFNVGICPACSRISGGYYEAIIQLRGNARKVEKFAKILEHEIGIKTFVSKVEEKKEGIDLYAGSNLAVYDLVKELGRTYKISKKLSGMKDGKKLYRTSYSIRFE